MSNTTEVKSTRTTRKELFEFLEWAFAQTDDNMSTYSNPKIAAIIIRLRGRAAPTGPTRPLSYITETLIIDPNHFSKSPRSEKYFRSFELRIFSKFSFLIIVKCQTIVLSRSAFKLTPKQGGNTIVKCFSTSTSGRTS